MHHPGPCAAAASHLSQGGVQPDAGLLAEGALHEAEHQGDPLHAPEPGQGLARLPGHTGLRQRSPCMYLVVFFCLFVLCESARDCLSPRDLEGWQAGNEGSVSV